MSAKDSLTKDQRRSQIRRCAYCALEILADERCVNSSRGWVHSDERATCVRRLSNALGDSFDTQLALGARVAELERERDPTAQAYEAVCRADQAKRARIAELEKIIARDDTTTSYKCSECGAWHLRKAAHEPRAAHAALLLECAKFIESCSSYDGADTDNLHTRIVDALVATPGETIGS